MTPADTYISQLQKSPGHKLTHPNSWADYIELVCLANPDNEVSKIDIIDRLAERVKDLKEDSDDDLKEFEDLELESPDETEPSRRAEISDKWQERAADYFNVLFLRQKLYDDRYPFIVSDESIQRKDVLTSNHLLYLYMVMCSNLYLFDKSTQNDFANSFELISFNAFKGFLPETAEAHLFGKNPYNRSSAFGSGTFLRKLNRLTKKVSEKKNPHLKSNEFSDHDTGDGGLDIVAWIPNGDKLSSSLIYFAQCACTYNFVEKQHSSSYNAWAQRLIMKNYPSNTTFIPHCFRAADGSWIRSVDIQFTFLVDRKRILNFYSDSRKYKFSSLPIYRVVQEIANLKEALI